MKCTVLGELKRFMNGLNGPPDVTSVANLMHFESRLFFGSPFRSDSFVFGMPFLVNFGQFSLRSKKLINPNVPLISSGGHQGLD